jgi:hypothetical protein
MFFEFIIFHLTHKILNPFFLLIAIMQRDLEYERNNIGYDYQYPQGGIKCKNYLLCHEVLPEWWWDCKECYLCTNCDMMFGNHLEAKVDSECPICLETKIGVKLMNCNHIICLECFKRIWYGDDSGEPQFPYSQQIEDEYYDDQDNPKWNIDYPFIQKYQQDHNQWDDNRQNKYANETNLRRCPLCRN